MKSHEIVGPDLIRALAFLFGRHAGRTAQPRVRQGVTENRSTVRHHKLALADGAAHLCEGEAPRRIGAIDKTTMCDFD
jgi:hypothetical protein